MKSKIKHKFFIGDRVFVFANISQDSDSIELYIDDPIPGIVIEVTYKYVSFSKEERIIYKVATREDKLIPIDRHRGSNIKILTIYEEKLRKR